MADEGTTEDRIPRKQQQQQRRRRRQRPSRPPVHARCFCHGLKLQSASSTNQIAPCCRPEVQFVSRPNQNAPCCRPGVQFVSRPNQIAPCCRPEVQFVSSTNENTACCLQAWSYNPARRPTRTRRSFSRPEAEGAGGGEGTRDAPSSLAFPLLALFRSVGPASTAAAAAAAAAARWLWWCASGRRMKSLSTASRNSACRESKRHN